MSAELQTSILVPSSVTAVSVGGEGSLIVGSADGTVRWYMPPSTKVVKAIKSVGEEIASTAWLPPKKAEPATLWVASGRRALCFALDSLNIINTSQDATTVLDIGEDDDDVLNELNISENGKYLAFSSDSGTVGVVDLASKFITRMKNRHTTICGSVKFIPDRPSEIVSGGYDSAVLHFDIGQGNILSRFDITAPTASEGATVSLSPPFVHCLSVSPTGLIVVSTADGRVWLGGGGEKRSDGKKKRSRKWEGLREDEGIWLQVADGPIVSVAFTHAERFPTCSLLGVLAEYSISRDSDGKLVYTKGWSASTRSLEKVNATAADRSQIVVGGFAKDGKGVVEIWRRADQEL